MNPFLLPRRDDAKMDAEGHCTVCGCEVREYEGNVGDDLAMRRHICPPGFRTVDTLTPNQNEH